MDDGRDLVGVGIYTIPEVSLLTRISLGKIRRWTRDYTYAHGGKRYSAAAVVTPSIHPRYGVPALTFLDMQEIRFLNAFHMRGVTWHGLRLAHAEAKSRLKHTHPFSTGRFVTDGRSIFTDVVEAARKDRALEDIVRRQFEFGRIVKPFLKDLEFDDDIASRWFRGRGRLVVLDPARRFGAPILAKEGIPTAVLAQTVKAERSVDRVARWWRIEPRSVRAAVEFERRLAA
jgi:uncharacterized protein (DUF433 family)